MVLLQNWNILCWNIRGLNSDKKRLALSNAITSSACSIICLQESKMSDFDLHTLKSLCPCRFDKYAYIPSVGALGGIITIWNSAIFNGTVLFSETFALGIKSTSSQSAQCWTLVNVYGPSQGEHRELFTEWLFNIDIPNNEEWLFLGDFNYFRSPDNRNKPGGSVQDMLTFNDFIREQHLVEIPIKGRMYTWSNMQVDPLLEQIDWFLTSTKWTSTFPNTIVKPLSRPVSDHIPCSVIIETKIPRIKIFRFENYWIAHPGFFEVVQQAWNRQLQLKNANATSALCQKFKHLRQALKQWSRKISRLSTAIENTNKALTELDDLENKRALTTPECNFRRILKAHLLRLLNHQKEYWKKRCTIRWIRFGDENSKLLQAIATERYRKNSIATLISSDGTVTEDHSGKESVLFEAFKERLGTSTPHNMRFDLPSIIK